MRGIFHASWEAFFMQVESQLALPRTIEFCFLGSGGEVEAIAISVQQTGAWTELGKKTWLYQNY